VSVGDPRTPETWSGVTAGIFSALVELGVQPQALDVTMPLGLERAMLAAGAAPTRNRFDAEGSPLSRAARTALVWRRLRGAGEEAILQIGTMFELPAGARYVTLEDMTLRQAVAVHPVFSRMSSRTVARWEKARERIYAGARMCAAASHWTGDSLKLDYGLPHERVAVVGFGANHTGSPAGREWLTPRFLFVGIDWERKGGPRVLRAFERLRQRTYPDAELDLVGGHPPIDQPGVRGHGVLVQQRARDRDLLSTLFARATCMVMPSEVEPFGIVHVEAAYAGIPSIASSVGGPRDVVGADGGIVVDPHDEDALLAAMERIADPQLARTMGAAAQRRSALYTWRLVAERLLRALGVEAPDGHALADFL
jgi:glycosyltransferase involved in cell wall biosynthesis